MSISKESINIDQDEGDSVPVRNQNSGDSLISIIFPWRGRTIPNRRALISRYESGRTITSVGFYMCMMSVLLLCTGVGLTAVSIWSLVYRVPYVLITDGSYYLEANNFTLGAGVITILCWWIGWIAHDNKKNYVFLPLLIVVLGLAIVMLISAIGLGFVQKSHLVFEKKSPSKSPKLIASRYKTSLNESLNSTLIMYHDNEFYKAAWNKVQQRLKCCGVDGPRDFVRVDKEIPWSCYLHYKCQETRTLLVRGCLDRIAYEFGWEICLLTGLSLIAFCVQLVTILLVCTVYVRYRTERVTLPNN